MSRIIEITYMAPVTVLVDLVGEHVSGVTLRMAKAVEQQVIVKGVMVDEIPLGHEADEAALIAQNGDWPEVEVDW